METPAETGDAASAATIAKLQQAKTDLDNHLAAPSANDAGQIIDNVRLSLLSYAGFQDAYTAASPYYVAAKRKAFDILRAAAQNSCDQVVTLANVDKPWLFASSSRKEAYKLRQDNAAQAKTLSTQLNDLAKTVTSSNDLRQLSAAITQATQAKSAAAGLYAASNAAAL